MAKDLKCLDGLIGYQTPCETVESRSGYMVNDLPDVSFTFAENIASPEYKNGKEYIDKVLNRAKRIVTDEMEQHMRPYFRYDAIMQSNQMCGFSQGYNATYTGQRGIRITKRYGSQYVSLYVPRVVIWIEEAAIISLKIDDGGFITNTAAMEIEANTPTEIGLNYHAKTNEVKISMDNTDVHTRSNTCQTGCCGAAPMNHMTNDVTVYGFDDTAVSQLNFFGIIPTVALECQMANLVCEINEHLALPILYKWAGLFYQEVSGTNRINKFTSLKNKEDAKERALYYDNPDQNEPGLYQRQMRSVIHSLFRYLQQSKDGCINCNSNRYEYVLP